VLALPPASQVLLSAGTASILLDVYSPSAESILEMDLCAIKKELILFPFYVMTPKSKSRRAILNGSGINFLQ
jgi:hypothetical protein